MTLDVLISCMYQSDTEIITKTNIQSGVIVINQCNVNNINQFSFKNINNVKCNATFISTTERGLSKSRNMAIKNSSASICLICDDDEILEDNYPQVIINAFESYDDDVILFKLNHPTRHFKEYSYKIGFFKTGNLGSWQIAFRRNSIIKNNILFNEKMGSGTGNGAGEENRFIMDCFKKKLKIRYVPDLIGTLIPSNESQWFNGYTEKFWINRGWQAKMIYGKFFGYLYIWYTIFRHHKEDLTNSIYRKINWLHKGFRITR